MRRPRPNALVVLAFSVAGLPLAFPAPRALAQSSAAVLQREQKPQAPEGLQKIGKQGNVVLAGRIDKSGKVQDIVPLATSNIGFVDNAVSALKAWEFQPAVHRGKPIDVSVNVVMRFRDVGPKRGEIPRPILGDLNIYPANTAGAKSSPWGFPIRRGSDPRLRVEAELDVPPEDKARALALRADAVSPTGRKINLHSGRAAVPAKAQTVKVQFSAPVGTDWEDGVWALQMTADDIPVGSGQFWLAGDPETFDFATQTAAIAEAAKNLPPGSVPPAKNAPSKPAPARAPTPRAKRT